MKKLFKSITGLLLATLLLCGAALPASAAMADIGGHWGAGAIQYCIDHGYLNGVTSSAFNPNGYVQRSQVAQALYNLAGKPDVSDVENPFADSRGHWAQEAIAWAGSAGVVKGISATAFDPDAYVTRDQVATMFQRYAGWDKDNANNGFTINPSLLNLYPDQNQIASWYREGMAWAVQYGFMQGSGGRLNPTGTLTRAELAQLIKNYFEPLEGVTPPAPDGKYHSVEAFLADPEVKKGLDEALSSLVDDTMNISIRGDKDILYYEFTFAQGLITDQAAIADYLLKEMQQPSFVEIFQNVAASMKLVLSPDIDPKIVVAYYESDGALIATMMYNDQGILVL